jgi:hypothetical protein
MKKTYLIFLLFVFFDSCIDRLEITSPNIIPQLVVEGGITDKPGPYSVKLTYTRKPTDYYSPPPVAAKEVIIFDNEGNSESLIQTSIGYFQTRDNGIRGIVGREYFVRIELTNGKIYESVPERINPAGVIDSAYYEFEEYQPEKEKTKYQFRVFIDSRGEAEGNGENHFLWKLTGTYRVQTRPDLHFDLKPGMVAKAPRPCSGYILDPATNSIGYIGPCECCQCWADIVSSYKPNVSDSYIVANNKFNRVDMGVIPVEFWHFWDKTLVTVEQFSLSKTAFDYWKTIRDQKEGATSLFQPAIGKARSNVFLKNGQEEVQGIFYAASVAKKIFFLTANDIPLGPGAIPPPPGLPPRFIPRTDEDAIIFKEFISADPFVVRESCLIAFAHSTTKRPADWK